MKQTNEHPITIHRLYDEADIRICARMMATSEPWLTLQRDEAVMFRALSDPTRELYGARDAANDIVGCILLCLQGAFVGYIQSICVRPESRSQGVGQQLMAYAEQRILRESPNVFLCVSAFNANAQRLYARLGYAVVGELPDYLVAGYAEILLRKTIAPIVGFKKGTNTIKEAENG